MYIVYVTSRSLLFINHLSEANNVNLAHCPPVLVLGYNGYWSSVCNSRLSGKAETVAAPGEATTGSDITAPPTKELPASPEKKVKVGDRGAGDIVGEFFTIRFVPFVKMFKIPTVLGSGEAGWIVRIRRPIKFLHNQIRMILKDQSIKKISTL